MKAYTDIEQSKKLAEILPFESADMWYWEWPTAPKYNNYEHPMFHKGDDIVNVPCWSLAALFEFITEPVLTYIDKNNWNISTFKDNHFKDEVISNNPVDACYEMILKLNELKLL